MRDSFECGEQVLREQAREKERLSRALRRMFEAEISKRRTFAKLALQAKAEAEGLAAILRDDACEGLELKTDEVRMYVLLHLFADAPSREALLENI